MRLRRWPTSRSTRGRQRPEKSSKENTRLVRQDRAVLMRRRLDDFSVRLPVTSIDLGSQAQLPADYAAGHAMGLSYSAAALPSENVLSEDLSTAISAYKALTFRGGLDPSPEVDDEDAPRVLGSLIELRRYKDAPPHRAQSAGCQAGQEVPWFALPSLRSPIR